MDAATTSGVTKSFCGNMGGTDIVGSEKGKKRSVLRGGFDGGAAIHFLAVDKAQHTDYLKFGIAGGLDGLNGGGAGGADVIDNDDGCGGSFPICGRESRG